LFLHKLFINLQKKQIKIMDIRNIIPYGYYNLYEWYCKKNGIKVETKNKVSMIIAGYTKNPTITDLLVKIFGERSDLLDKQGLSAMGVQRRATLKEMQAFRERIAKVSQEKKLKNTYIIYRYWLPAFSKKISANLYRRVCNGDAYCLEVLDFLENVL
jgi:hypothetical protein